MNIVKGKQIICYKRTQIVLILKSKCNIPGLVNKIDKNAYQQAEKCLYKV